MSLPYPRRFRYGDSGGDVEAVGRALSRSKTPGNTPLAIFAAFPRRIRRRWGTRKQADLKRFKARVGLRPDDAYTRDAHTKLTPYFDAKARKLLTQHEPPHSEADQRWLALLAAMRDVHEHTPGYRYGGGHGVRLDEMDSGAWFDCSSSSSWALHKAGLFPSEYAWVSGQFARSYGNPGKGTYFTVWANDGHVWLQLHKRPPLYWRFDTSPQGDPQSPRSGARLRYLPRFTTSFTPRHFPGM